jgi:hypothetical protein
MTKKLDDAIAKVRELPDTDQDLAADLLLSILAEPTPLDDEARSAIREVLIGRDGGSSFPTRKSKLSGNATINEDSRRECDLQCSPDARVTYI